MSYNTMKIEFYKPKYDLDIKFDGDNSFDLLFKNISGEFFFSADVEDYDSYISFEDEDCKFTNGELEAKVNITDLVETIANGQFRNTNGTSYGEWIPKIVGDYKTEPTLIFDGVGYADRDYWELFFKEMPKNEIKDFIEFCREHIGIPNLEFSSRSFSFDKHDILVSDRGNSITINDYLTIEMAQQFACKSSDAIEVWEMNHDYGEDDYEFEEKKTLKEGINDELIATSSDGETTLYLSDERQANHGKDPHYEFKLGENGYFTRYIRCDDKRCENVVLDWIKEFDLDISKSEISKIIKLHESKKFTRKSMKESTDESFSLYDLNKHDPFVKEWVKNINKELKDVSIESIGDDEIVFRVWFDESMGLDVFDDIATDCMPRTLIEFMSDMNIDFGYQFVYADDKFAENDFVFIRFVAW